MFGEAHCDENGELTPLSRIVPVLVCPNIYQSRVILHGQRIRSSFEHLTSICFRIFISTDFFFPSVWWLDPHHIRNLLSALYGATRKLSHKKLLNLRNHSLFCRDSSLPSERRGNVLRRRPRLARLAVKVLSISASRDSIVVPEEPALLELGQQKLDNVFEGLREEGVSLHDHESVRYAISIFSLNDALTKLKPSISASLTQASSPSATCEGVPTRTGPLPPKLTCSAMVCLVHLAVPGENLA